MKPLASRRAAPGRPSVDERAKKINRLWRKIDVRRYKKLNAYLAETGKEIDRARIARKKGHKNGNMVSQILNGHSAMNEIWMLYIADDLLTVPQIIWARDWPLSGLTPNFRDPELLRVIRRWPALTPLTRKKLITLAESPPASH